MKLRTIFELVVIGGLLFYIFGLEPTLTKYNELKTTVGKYMNNTLSVEVAADSISSDTVVVNNNFEIVSDTIVVTDTIVKKDTIHISNTQYSDSIPFVYENKRIKITIYVDDIPVNGILDTGADSGLFLSYIEYEYFRRQGVKIGNLTKGTASGVSGTPVEIYSGYLNNVKIGSKILDKVDAQYCEITESTDGTTSENLFGINIFNKKFTVDYDKNKIYFY